MKPPPAALVTVAGTRAVSNDDDDDDDKEEEEVEAPSASDSKINSRSALCVEAAVISSAMRDRSAMAWKWPPAASRTARRNSGCASPKWHTWKSMVQRWSATSNMQVRTRSTSSRWWPVRPCASGTVKCASSGSLGADGMCSGSPSRRLYTVSSPSVRNHTPTAAHEALSVRTRSHTSLSAASMLVPPLAQKTLSSVMRETAAAIARSSCSSPLSASVNMAAEKPITCRSL